MTTDPDRRRWLLASAMLGLLPLMRPAHAARVTDSAGRSLQVPARVERVFPAGPPAAILLYTLAPDLLLGWPRANRPDELEFLQPDIGRRPEVGRITGRGNSANLESVLALKPDLIVDSGSMRPTYVELAERVQAQTGIPYALLDGRFAAIPDSYERLGALVGRESRARELAEACADAMRTVTGRVARVPLAERPRVYYARGPDGLQTGLGGSINTEIMEFMGLNLVGRELQGGLSTVSIEQVLAWDPDLIVTTDPSFAAEAGRMRAWRGVRAVRERRVHLSPRLPFGWIDFPPGVNRIPGLWWLGKTVFPQLFPENLLDIARDFYRRFYGVEPSDAQLRHVLAAPG
ncbi:MAG: iron ABC transporter substrate-binding protein [Burkholderiales bacterium]|nr:iron ABC transporter substrate-binding protein [Burkholderiales bacterium]